MRRTFLGVTYCKPQGSCCFSNKIVGEITNGLQERNGEIISISLSRVFSGEHLLIFYEDNNNFLEIEKFLEKYVRIEFNWRVVRYDEI